VPLGPALGGFARSGGLFRDPAPPALSRSDLVELRPTRRLVVTARVARYRIGWLVGEGTGSGLVALLVASLVEGGARADLEHGVEALVEANVLERDGDRARLTAFGRWVVDTWVEEQLEPLEQLEDLERFEGLA
jgi:hypothetical protein